MSRKLLEPGTMVTCRHDVVGTLVLWSAPFSDIDEDVGSACPDDVLLIIKSKRNPSVQTKLISSVHTITEEWKSGSYMVLAPSGVVGWVGAGWVVPITT